MLVFFAKSFFVIGFLFMFQGKQTKSAAKAGGKKK